MDAGKITRFVVVLMLAMGLCLFSGALFSPAYCEDIIIIEPEPDPELPPDIIPVDPPVPPPEEPPVEPPVEPPEEPPVEVEGIEAAINIDPDTINLKSKGNYITAYIELPSGYDVRDIDANSVKIVGVNGEEIAQPIAALTAHTSVGDQDGDAVADLALKFDRDTVENELPVGEAVTLELQGAMNDGKELYGEDTVRVIGVQSTTRQRAKKWKFYYNLWKKHHPQGTQSGQHVSTGTIGEQYLFCLSKHLGPNARIKSVILWLKTPQGFADGTYPDYAWHFKLLKNWEQITGRRGDLRFKNLTKGKGCEWDISGRVTADWAQGVTNVIVKFTQEGKAVKRPCLVVTYEQSGTAAAPEDSAAERQNLVSYGEKVQYQPGPSDADNTITLYYPPSVAAGADPKTISIYYWNRAASLWAPLPGSVLNAAENSVTGAAVYSTYYKLMGPSRAAAVSTQPASNTLAQNFPNPFSRSTTITYSLAGDSHVTLKLFNSAGELVATILDEYQSSGAHSVQYTDGESLARGIYFYQLKAGDYVETKRMVILK